MLPERSTFHTAPFIRAAALLLAALLPFLSVAFVIFLTPRTYDGTFDAELSQKTALLDSTEGPKIVVIGGSSVAFGLDSAALSEKTGYPVVNFGLYAALGTKVMLDLARDGISPGDIVVIAPEIENDTLSLFFNAGEIWRAAEADPALLPRIGSDDYPALAGASLSFAGEKMKYLLRGTRPAAANPAYSLEAFNEAGDIVWPRPANVMGKRGYDKNNLIRMAPDVLDPAFVGYLKEFSDFCRKRGAQAVFSYPPMNSPAVSPEYAPEDFDAYLRAVLPLPVISRIGDYLLPPEVFYDTNFHLNDSGVPLRTEQLYRDLAAYFSDRIK